VNAPLRHAGTRHLIFIHGGGVGPWMWDRQRQYFSTDFTVHTPTLPGHDPASRTRYFSHSHAAAAIAAQIGIRELTGEVTVVGFSAGGQVAIELATLFPGHINRTVVVSSLVSPWRSAPLLAHVAGLAAPLAQIRGFARAQARQLVIPDAHLDAYLLLSRSLARQSLVNLMRANFAFHLPADFVDSPHPVLLVAGTAEQKRLINDLHRLSARLHRGSFSMINGVAHGAPLAAASQFNSVLANWLDSPIVTRSDDKTDGSPG